MATQLLTSGLPVLARGGASGLGHWTQGDDLKPSLLWARLLRSLLQACSRVVAFWGICFAFFARFRVPFLVLFLVPKWGPDLAILIVNVLAVSSLVPISGPILGTIFGPRNQQHFCFLVLVLGKFWLHIWVPRACCEVRAYLQWAKVARSYAAHAHAAPMLV